MVKVGARAQVLASLVEAGTACCTAAAGTVAGEFLFGSPYATNGFADLAAGAVVVLGTLVGLGVFLAAFVVASRKPTQRTRWRRGGVVLAIVVGSVVGLPLGATAAYASSHNGSLNIWGPPGTIVSVELRDHTAGNATDGTVRCAETGRLLGLATPFCPSVRDGPYILVLATSTSCLVRPVFMGYFNSYQAHVDAAGNITLDVAHGD